MRGLAWIVPFLAVGVTACGTSDSERFSLRTPGTDDPVVREIEGSQKPRRGKPTKNEVSVIRGWADALRAGHVDQASAFFAVPAIIADGVNPTRTVADRNGLFGHEVVSTAWSFPPQVLWRHWLERVRWSPSSSGSSGWSGSG